MRKLENFLKFALGPSVDRVLMTGLTLSMALGEGNEASDIIGSETETSLAMERCEYPCSAVSNENLHRDLGHRY